MDQAILQVNMDLHRLTLFNTRNLIHGIDNKFGEAEQLCRWLSDYAEGTLRDLLDDEGFMEMSIQFPGESMEGEEEEGPTQLDEEDGDTMELVPQPPRKQ